jgi:hypothetical protein
MVLKSLFALEQSSIGLSLQVECDLFTELQSVLDIPRQSASCSLYRHMSLQVSFLFVRKTHNTLTCCNVAILLFVFAHYSDKLKMRFPFILAGLSMSLIGFSLNISTVSHGVKYFGTFFVVMGNYAAVPGAISWCAMISRVTTGTNICDEGSETIFPANTREVSVWPSTLASPISVAQSHPTSIDRKTHLGLSLDVSLTLLLLSRRLTPCFADALELMFVGTGFIFLPILVYRYKRINAQRDAIERLTLERGERVQYSDQELRELGDCAPDFRYTL